jgi:putative endonuclease
MAKHLKQGQKAEMLAARYLANIGYQILDKNYRSGRAEIDIIGQIGKFLVFFEVKSFKKHFTEIPRIA